MKSQAEIGVIQEHFIKKYLTDPLNNPINSVGISRIDICLRYKNGVLDPPLSDQESDQDLCLSVGFESEPADRSQYPKIFEDVRVFYKVIGTIRAL